MLETLSAPQAVYLETLGTKYRAFVGGFGSGKTFVGCLDLLFFAARQPGTRQAYYAPTYTDVNDTFYPTFEEAAWLLGFTIRIRRGAHEVDILRGRWYYGTIICRSMNHPERIVGYKVARSLVDEIDTLPLVKAEAAWRKILARQRLKIDGVVNGVGVTTTPEGFNWVHSRFKEDPTESYSMVQASTYENLKYLPDDYISSLLESYPSQLVLAYVGGQFVNLTSGTVYYNFDRTLNGTHIVESLEDRIHIGMDFNVGKMAAVAHVKREEKAIAVNEFVNLLDTPQMIQKIQDTYPEHAITVYPDASGKNRATNDALKNDISLLQQAGFDVEVDLSNPRVKSRVTSMNSMFCNAKGVRRYLVNTDRCPTYTKCLEQQAYNEQQEPDKKAGFDHPNDAGGYFICKAFPVDKPIMMPGVNIYG